MANNLPYRLGNWDVRYLRGRVRCTLPRTDVLLRLGQRGEGHEDSGFRNQTGLRNLRNSFPNSNLAQAFPKPTCAYRGVQPHFGRSTQQEHDPTPSRCPTPRDRRHAHQSLRDADSIPTDSANDQQHPRRVSTCRRSDRSSEEGILALP